MTARELLKIVESAFRGVRLGDGIGLLEGNAIDRCYSDKHVAALRKKDREIERWQDVPGEAFETNPYAHCYVDAAGTRFFLPACMKWTILRAAEDPPCIEDMALYWISPRMTNLTRFEGFTEAQGRAVLRFLEYMAERCIEADDEFAFDDAMRAIELHWGRDREDAAPSGGAGGGAGATAQARWR